MIAALRRNRSVAGIVDLGLPRKREPHVAGFGTNRELKALRHHADDRKRPPAKVNRASDHAWVPFEMGAPESVTQDHDVVPGLVLAGEEVPAERGPHAKQDRKSVV